MAGELAVIQNFRLHHYSCRPQGHRKCLKLGEVLDRLSHWKKQNLQQASAKFQHNTDLATGVLHYAINLDLLSPKMPRSTGVPAKSCNHYASSGLPVRRNNPSRWDTHKCNSHL